MECWPINLKVINLETAQSRWEDAQLGDLPMGVDAAVTKGCICHNITITVGIWTTRYVDPECPEHGER